MYPLFKTSYKSDLPDSLFAPYPWSPLLPPHTILARLPPPPHPHRVLLPPGYQPSPSHHIHPPYCLPLLYPLLSCTLLCVPPDTIYPDLHRYLLQGLHELILYCLLSPTRIPPTPPPPSLVNLLHCKEFEYKEQHHPWIHCTISTSNVGGRQLNPIFFPHFNQRQCHPRPDYVPP